MTDIKEMLANDSFVDDSDDVRSYADIADSLDSHPVSDASIAQGFTNLENWRKEQATVEEGEKMLRHYRERKLMEEALQNAGPHETLDEHRQTMTTLLDAASDISMYRGGEKGGYKTRDFNERYGEHVATVEAGARSNHAEIVRKVIPGLYKAAELLAAGFSSYDIDDDVNQMRFELMDRFGGPINKDNRAKMRASLK